MKALAVLLVWLMFFSVNSRDHSSTAFENLKSEVTGDDDLCLLWQIRNNSTGRCSCGDKDLQGLVLCNDNPYSLRLYECFCMTYCHETKLTLVGSCLYTCNPRSHQLGYYMDISVNTTSQINEFMCSGHNRQSQLCGSCVTGYAPPVYSYSLSCVNCTISNWAKYTAVSLLPVTAFFVFVIMFSLSATSPKLSGFILCMQILTCPPNMRIMARNIDIESLKHRYIMQLVSSLYSIWNLDFFRLVYRPFCLQPDTNTLQVLALDYLIGVYPLLLVALTYLLVLLYDHNFRLIVCLWKPFAPLFSRCRRQWNIRSSLVDAFATFLLFSYVKILSVSVDLLTPVLLYDQRSNILQQFYVFNQGDVPFLHSQHLPYACLAVFFLLTFTLWPMLLLFLYPCSCFQACLNRTGCSYQPLHTFMDTFQGHYKNGTNGTRDLRFFSGLNLLLRVVVYSSTVFNYQIASYAYTTVVIGVLAFCSALARPYKKHYHNVIETLSLAVLTALSVTLGPQIFGQPHRIEDGLAPIVIVLLLIPFIYLTVLVGQWFKSWRLVLRCWNALHLKLMGDKQHLPLLLSSEDHESLYS